MNRQILLLISIISLPEAKGARADGLYVTSLPVNYKYFALDPPLGLIPLINWVKKTLRELIETKLSFKVPFHTSNFEIKLLLCHSWQFRLSRDISRTEPAYHFYKYVAFILHTHKKKTWESSREFPKPRNNRKSFINRMHLFVIFG